MSGGADWELVPGQTRCKPSVNTGEQQQRYIDQNGYSSTYGQTKWITTGITCTCTPLSTCSGPDKKILNGCCETGIKVYTNYQYDYTLGKCKATYHFSFTDLSISQDYTEYLDVCPEEN